MEKQVFAPKLNDLVRVDGLDGVFKVTGVQVGGNRCFIQRFNVSKLALANEDQQLVECSVLTPFREDASQAAARIAKEATQD